MNANVIGVYDAVAKTFDASVSTGTLTGGGKFFGATTVGTKVVFAPKKANVIGVYDAVAKTFDASVSTGTLTMGGKFMGAATVGTKVVFAPFSADVVGVFKPEQHTISYEPCSPGSYAADSTTADKCTPCPSPAPSRSASTPYP